jgi:hypothetical protein
VGRFFFKVRSAKNSGGDSLQENSREANARNAPNLKTNTPISLLLQHVILSTHTLPLKNLCWSYLYTYVYIHTSHTHTHTHTQKRI